MCPEKGCTYVAPIREKRGCRTHTHKKMVQSDECPVEFVYTSIHKTMKKITEDGLEVLFKLKKDETIFITMNCMGHSKFAILYKTKFCTI